MRRKGVDGFSVETPGLVMDSIPISSSDSLTNAWAPTVHKLCHNQAFVDYVMYSSFAYRQFNSNLTIMPYELIQPKSWHCWSERVTAQGVASP
ncbi:hypothetical protein AVEN_171581-1 [Araneus ventricosus]|uniref:Uncharacterized protein n=1 Tax=Araneus ventricosus TaxID=182803 RepID=A0A4Y2HXN9_ARAVE|nr:hypothetical protein AVEN_171581-1 [Araneus ventricosus]